MPRFRACGLPLVCLLSAAVAGTAASPALAQTELLEKAAGKPTIASSVQSSTYAASKGNDSSMSTRWSSSFSDGQWWQVDLGATTSVSQVRVAWEAAYASRYRISTSTDKINWTVAGEETASGAGERTTSFAARNARYVRLTAVTRGTKYGISFFELKVLGTPDAALLEKAKGQPATASSTERSGREADKGNDGSRTTRWSSSFTDGQWWQVDLGTARSVSRLKVAWEAAYASKYRISTSTDARTWSTAAEETASGAGDRTTSFAARDARYVRLTAVTRGTKYGVSFFETEVLGPQDSGTGVSEPAPSPTPAPTPTAPSEPAVSEPVPSETSAPAPVADVLPSPIVPLAAGNPFTTPLPRTGVPLHSASEQDAFRNELRFLVDKGARVEQSQYSASLYIVHRDGDIYDTAGRKKASGAPFVKPTGPITALNQGIEGRGWPLQSWMQPDPGEGHLAMYNPETGAFGEFIFAKVGSGSLNYTWGGYIPDSRRSKGMATPANPWWGGTAFGLNLAGFTITEHEMRKAIERYRAGDYENAYIPHVIGYEAYRHHPNQWHYPASKTDDMGSKVPRWGEGGDPNRLGNGLGVLRMGGIFRLDPSIDVQTQIRGDGTAFGDMMARIIARTYQKHGATMTDQTEAGFALLAEHVRTTGGAWDSNSVSYGSGAPWGYGTAWLAPMMRQAIDNKWLQFVYTGRNLEVDTGGAPPAGAYRPAP